ncbi:hypothetical protein J6590_065852 [Homalodisca vitripennis]|nr:hypothetical protein J6590_065852 [Homalodisca vitripennis]
MPDKSLLVACADHVAALIKAINVEQATLKLILQSFIRRAGAAHRQGRCSPGKARFIANAACSFQFNLSFCLELTCRPKSFKNFFSEMGFRESSAKEPCSSHLFTARLPNHQ